MEELDVHLIRPSPRERGGSSGRSFSTWQGRLPQNSIARDPNAGGAIDCLTSSTSLSSTAAFTVRAVREARLYILPA
jgi:hypothetical protein